MKHFDSFTDYFHFSTAREFVYKETCNLFSYSKNRLEKIGDVFVSPFMKPGHYVLKNIRNPLLITAVVIMSLALTTLIFYPAVLSMGILPVSALKAGVYLLTQSTLVGLCMRTLGRLNNQELMSSWNRQQIQPVRIGAVIISF